LPLIGRGTAERERDERGAIAVLCPLKMEILHRQDRILAMRSVATTPSWQLC